MIYFIDYTDKASDDLLRLRKEAPKAFDKVKKLIEELKEHPRTGTGHPEQLKGDRSGQWSRHITQKHRLIYTINDHVVTVLVLTAYGHYDDK